VGGRELPGSPSVVAVPPDVGEQHINTYVLFATPDLAEATLAQLRAEGWTAAQADVVSEREFEAAHLERELESSLIPAAAAAAADGGDGGGGSAPPRRRRTPSPRREWRLDASESAELGAQLAELEEEHRRLSSSVAAAAAGRGGSQPDEYAAQLEQWMAMLELVIAQCRVNSGGGRGGGGGGGGAGGGVPLRTDPLEDPVARPGPADSRKITASNRIPTREAEIGVMQGAHRPETAPVTPPEHPGVMDGQQQGTETSQTPPRSHRPGGLEPEPELSPPVRELRWEPEPELEPEPEPESRKAFEQLARELSGRWEAVEDDRGDHTHGGGDDELVEQCVVVVVVVVVVTVCVFVCHACAAFEQPPIARRFVLEVDAQTLRAHGSHPTPRDAGGAASSRQQVSQNGYLLSRRGRSLPANASGFDTHRDSISSRFDCSSSWLGRLWRCCLHWTSASAWRGS
jgi:hypothetical protein